MNGSLTARNSPDVLVRDADDVADELADGVFEAGDGPHHLRDGVHLLPELLEAAGLQKVVLELGVICKSVSVKI
jgi:hypothetical protein